MPRWRPYHRVALVCICRSPRILSLPTRCGSRCSRASAISPRGSRSSGGIQSRPELRIGSLARSSPRHAACLKKAVLVSACSSSPGRSCGVDVVCLGAGEVQKAPRRRRRAPRLAGPPEPRLELHVGARLALRDDFRHLAVRDEVVHHRGAVAPLRGHHDVRSPIVSRRRR